jgi:hypothetical protein
MKFNLQVSDGPTASTLNNETWLNGVQILNVEQVRYLFNKHEVTLKIRVPDINSGKMRLREFTLPKEQTQLLELNTKLQELSKLLTADAAPLESADEVVTDDSGRKD